MLVSFGVWIHFSNFFTCKIRCKRYQVTGSAGKKITKLRFSQLKCRVTSSYQFWESFSYVKMIPIFFELFVSVTGTSVTKGRTILSCRVGKGWANTKKILHSFCRRNEIMHSATKQRNILQVSQIKFAQSF